MSAIAGYCFFDGRPPDAEPAHAMGRVLAHRGPGALSVLREGSACLAYRPHATTPTTAEQVDQDGDGRYTIVADARLDNRSELGARLGLPPADVARLSDQALILRAFLQWGRDGFSHLIGDFAAAIWDRDRSTLTCARDPFGVRPLYVHRTASLFAFASEPKALFASGLVPKVLDEVRLAEYLALIRADARRTIYEGVSLLGAAEALTVSPGGTETASFYRLAPEAGLHGRTHDDLVEGFRSRFWDAVTACSRGEGPAGSYLSGGLDSSSVACVARDVLRERSLPLHTFSAVYDGVPDSNERPYIESVTDEGGIVPHFLDGDQVSPLENLDDMYTRVDDDPAGGNHHIVLAMLEQARSSGVQVLLDGHDGDNVVGHGLEHLDALATRGDWKLFADHAVAVSDRFRREDQLQPFQRLLTSPGRVFAKSGFGALQELALRRDVRGLARGVLGARRHLGVSRSQLARALARPLLGIAAPARSMSDVAALSLDVVSPDFARRTGLRELATAAGATPIDQADAGSVVDGRLQILQSPVFTRGITQVNVVTGTFGIESRHPFLNRTLVEYSLGLPPEMLLRDGWTRYVLRTALRDVLPRAISERAGKSDHTAAYVHTFTTFEDERLATWAADPGPFAEYVRPERLRDLHRQVMSPASSDVGAERTLLSQLYTTYKLLEKNGLL